MKKLYFLLLFILSASLLNAQTIRYVKPTATGVGDGSTWTNASGNLQDMINASASGDEVWVAAGKYLPTERLQTITYVASPANGVSTTNRDKTFIMKGGVKVYGGFMGNGTETSLSQRNYLTNETILSGDLNDDKIASTGDAYHVVSSRNAANGAILDGFTIKHGYADGAANVSASGTDGTSALTISQKAGAGIALRGPNNGIQFTNLMITDNYASDFAGAVSLYISGTSLVIPFTNVQISNNTSVAEGGAVRIYSSSGTPTVKFTNSKFLSNISGTSGSAVYYYSAMSTLTQTNPVNTYFLNVNFSNCLFYNNDAKSNTIGGTLYASIASNSTIVNSTFYANKSTGTSGKGGGIYINSASATLNLYNSILNGNVASSSEDLHLAAGSLTVKNTLTQIYGTTGVDGNLVNASPTLLFGSINPVDATFLTLVEGAATEKGDNILAAGITTDLAGNPRVKHTNVDLGAYEYQGTLPVELLYFKAVASGNASLLTWKTASEKNNQKFIIERGTTPSNFTLIKEQLGAGDSGAATSYSYTDKYPTSGVNYYRLTQYDKDGTSTALGIQAVTFSIVTPVSKLYPNPAASTFAIKLGELPSEPINVNLISLLGKSVLAKTFSAAELQQEISLSLADIPAGTYIVSINKGKMGIEKQTLLVVK